jgi:hypothetical protein
MLPQSAGGKLPAEAVLLTVNEENRQATIREVEFGRP